MAVISVILPTYNREKVITESIYSVLNQTFRDIELIIVDDNSVDDTEAIIRRINDDRLFYFRLDRNHGANYARNYGIEKSKGEYVAFQDSDDVWESSKLEKQMLLISKLSSDYAMVFCSLKKDYGKDRIVPHVNSTYTDGIIYKELKKRNFISTQTILCKKNVLTQINGFDIDLPALQDWDLVLRISKLYRIAHLREALVCVRISDNSVTRNSGKVLDAMYLLMQKYDKDLSKEELRKWNYSASFDAIKANKVYDAKNLLFKAIGFKSKTGVFALIRYIKIVLFN